MIATLIAMLMMMMTGWFLVPLMYLLKNQPRDTPVVVIVHGLVPMINIKHAAGEKKLKAVSWENHIVKNVLG